MSKQLTRSEKQTIRAYVLERDGAEKARLMADGAVNVYGTMPNTNEDGWYFAGWAEELLAMAAAEQR
jgi:hypothetical protein